MLHARARSEPFFRPAELSLLVLPCLLVLGGIATILIAKGEELTVGTMLLAIAIVGIVGIGHAVLVWLGVRGDQVIVPLTIALSSIGIIMVFRIGEDVASLEGFGTRQAIWLGISTLAMLATVYLLPDPSRLRHFKYSFAVGGLVLVAITSVFGHDFGSGSRSWLVFGPVAFQPSEVLKVFLVVFFAAYLDDYRELIAKGVFRIGPISLPPIPYLAPLVIMWAASLFLMVVERDHGTAMLYFGIVLALLYVASSRLSYVVTAFLAFAGGAVVLYRFVPVIRERVEIWINPWSQEVDGYQIVQALISYASGGLFGAGLGQGQPYLVPAVQTDFIMAAIGEELGLAGTLAVVSLYLLLIGRIYLIARTASTSFEQLLAAGLATVLALQTFIILAGNLRLIPLTGITLPFVSYGGSSLLTNFVIIGLLLRISERRTPAEE